MLDSDSAKKSRGPLVEVLESRRLMSVEAVAAAATPQEIVNPFHTKIDFLPITATGIAEGYRGDNGLAFGLRRNGLTYGWHTNNVNNVVGRTVPGAPPDSPYDSFGEFVGPNSWWAIAVPNGRYRVRIVMGDPQSLDAHYKFEVEGVQALDYVPTADEPWAAAVIEVNVKDGALAMKGAPGGENNKLSLVEITQIEPLAVTWADATELPARNGRVEPGAARVGNKLYTFGGYRRSPDNQVTRAGDVLDFESGTWSSLAPIPGGAAESHAGVATDGEWIYWAGGQVGGGPDVTQLDATDAVWRYHIPTDTWERYIDLPESRSAAGMAMQNGVLHLFGGNGEDRSRALDTHWVLSTRSANPTWAEAAPLPRAGDHKGVAVVNGLIYLIGGEDNHGTTYDQHADVYAYDPSSDTWTRKADMPIPSSHFEDATLVIGTKILVMGGRVDLPEQFTSQVRVYDTLLDQWTVLDPLPVTRLGGVAGVYNGRVYFTQGYSKEQGFTAESFWGTLSGFGS